jgi:hypothetical protein
MTPDDETALARALFIEYARWLAVDLCFQGFDAGSRRCPARMRAHRTVAACGRAGTAFGCIALRPLLADDCPATAT